MFSTATPFSRPLATLACLLALAGYGAVSAQPAQPGQPTKATDVNNKVPTSPPGGGAVDRSARCAPAAVNECRAQCDSKRYDTSNKAELAKKQNECKVDCSRAC